MPLPDFEHVACDLCGKDEPQRLFSGKDNFVPGPERFELVRCANCGLMYLDPRPAPGVIGRYYPGNYLAYQEFEVQAVGVFNRNPGRWSVFKNRVKRSILRDYFHYRFPAEKHPSPVERMAALCFLPQFNRRFYRVIPFSGDGRLLDIGCGNAANLVLLKELGWQVRGIEINRHCCAFAKEKFDIEVDCADPVDATFGARSFDCITMWHFLEHHHRPSKVLERCREWLTDEGLLVIGLPNCASLEARTLKAHSALFDFPRHLYDFTPRTLKKLVEAKGFSLERMIYSTSMPSFDWSLNTYAAATGKKWRVDSSLRMNPLVIAADYLLSFAHLSSSMILYCRKRA
ncbi:MAG: class I SAM-dependent methyltransferase [Candidatus Omnitrophica bacterium]|nr:class I SAM-dependent methyltransferase [Candidatus Omnitrophota bacterium]